MKSKKMYNLIWFTGQAGAGKTVLANELKNHLQNITNEKIVIIDGDLIRELYENTDYSIEGRKANVNFVQKLCTYLIENEILPVVCMVSPFAEQRRKFIEENKGIEIYVYCNEIRGRENYHVDYYEKPIESEISVSIDTTNKNVKQSFNELWKIIS